MSQKNVFVPGVGDVTLSKRRGTTNIKLSINAAGKIRVSMPYWAPYATGINFLKTKTDWIQKQIDAHSTDYLKDGDLIGKAHRLKFAQDYKTQKISSRITPTTILITSNLPFNNVEVQKKAMAASERALKAEADKLLPQRLALLAEKYSFNYKSVKVRKLTARWGSCSSSKEITLSYYLLQLPWHLIDYVLLHELTHTEHLNHSKSFWERFMQVLPAAKQCRREIRNFRPVVQAHKQL
jgi:predicted metal-dependent hydrolase